MERSGRCELKKQQPLTVDDADIGVVRNTTPQALRQARWVEGCDDIATQLAVVRAYLTPEGGRLLHQTPALPRQAPERSVTNKARSTAYCCVNARSTGPADC